MIKSIFFTVTLISVATMTHAQIITNNTDNREKFQIGVKAGANYSNVYDMKGQEFTADPKLGFAGGVFLEIPIGKYLGLNPELLVSQKGFKADGRLLNNNYSFTRTTSFIDIPLMIAFKPSEFITLLAGPQFSYLFRQKDVFASSPYSYVQEQEFKNDDFRKNLVGVVAGANINIKHIVIGARIAWDLQANNKNNDSYTPRYKNTWLQATLGYKIYKINK